MSQKDCVNRYVGKFTTVSVRLDAGEYEKVKKSGKSANQYFKDLMKTTSGTDLGIDPQLMKDLPAYARAVNTAVPEFLNTLIKWQFNAIDKRGPVNETERGFKYNDVR